MWTTTPWTLPANLAVAVNGRLEYCVAEHASHGRLVVARALVDTLAEKLGGPLEVLATFTGDELAQGTKYVRPLPDEEANGLAAEAPVVVGGEYITADGGTGLVHTAPGHGADDYATGLKAGVAGGPFSPVDDAGRYTAAAGERFKGLQVTTAGNDAVVSALSAENGTGALLLLEPYEHKYPYDWRTKKPVITRATSQWFAASRASARDAVAAIGG